MKQIPKEELISILKPYFKNSGFKKSKATWHKITDDIGSLKKLYIQNKLPLMTFVKVKKFLEGVDLQQNF